MLDPTVPAEADCFGGVAFDAVNLDSLPPALGARIDRAGLLLGDRLGTGGLSSGSVEVTSNPSLRDCGPEKALARMGVLKLV